jgi:hypothetical protein
MTDADDDADDGRAVPIGCMTAALSTPAEILPCSVVAGVAVVVLGVSGR